MFLQAPYNHITGQGCPICGNDKKAMSFKKSTQKFIKESVSIHGSKYDYSNVVYKNNKTKVQIKCPIHGEFHQAPSHHLNGHGCKHCGAEYDSRKKEDWIRKSKGKNGIFYIIRCYNETESFYKYGITFNSVSSGYASLGSMPYKYEIIKTISSSDKSYIWDLEKRFGRLKQKHRYSPQKYFNVLS